MKYVVGVDVGVTGAIAFVSINDKTDNFVLDIPVITTKKAGKTRRSLDFEALNIIFEEAKPEIAKVIVEALHPMPTNGSISSFNLGMSYGGMLGVIAACKLEVTLVSPVKWKKHFDLLKKEKNISLLLAREKFGTEFLLRAKDHNRAEALLIAEYGLNTEF